VLWCIVAVPLQYITTLQSNITHAIHILRILLLLTTKFFKTHVCNFRLSTYFQSVLYQMMYWHNLILLMMGTCYSKHVEAWNKYIEKSASSWSLKRKKIYFTDLINVRKMEHIKILLLLLVYPSSFPNKIQCIRHTNLATYMYIDLTFFNLIMLIIFHEKSIFWMSSPRNILPSALPFFLWC
jgi:hypothetical protein